MHEFAEDADALARTEPPLACRKNPDRECVSECGPSYCDWEDQMFSNRMNWRKREEIE